jgi:hypothetical protein
MAKREERLRPLLSSMAGGAAMLMSQPLRSERLFFHFVLREDESARDAH